MTSSLCLVVSTYLQVVAASCLVVPLATCHRGATAMPGQPVLDPYWGAAIQAAEGKRVTDLLDLVTCHPGSHGYAPGAWEQAAAAAPTATRARLGGNKALSFIVNDPRGARVRLELQVRQDDVRTAGPGTRAPERGTGPAAQATELSVHV